MDPELKDVIKNILIASIGPAIGLIGTIFIKFISSIELRSKDKNQYLNAFFYNVLLPLTKILNEKNYDDIDVLTIEAMEEIHTEFFHLIPSNLRMDYNYFKRIRNSSNIKKIKKSYNTYRTGVIMYFLKIRKKLKLPKESNWIAFYTFPIWMQICILILYVGLLLLYVRLVWKIDTPLYIYLCIFGSMALTMIISLTDFSFIKNYLKTIISFIKKLTK